MKVCELLGRPGLGAASEVSFEVVEQIPRGPDGKFRAVRVLKDGEAYEGKP